MILNGFHFHGFGPSSDRGEALQLLRTLQSTTVAVERAAIIQRLAHYTQCLVQQYGKQLSAKHERVFSRINIENSGSVKVLPNFGHLGYRISSLHLAFERMNEFLAVYPIISTLPEEQVVSARPRAMPGSALTVNVERKQQTNLIGNPKTEKTQRAGKYLVTLFKYIQSNFSIILQSDQANGKHYR